MYLILLNYNILGLGCIWYIEWSLNWVKLICVSIILLRERFGKNLQETALQTTYNRINIACLLLYKLAFAVILYILLSKG